MTLSPALLLERWRITFYFFLWDKGSETELCSYGKACFVTQVCFAGQESLEDSFWCALMVSNGNGLASQELHMMCVWAVKVRCVHTSTLWHTARLSLISLARQTLIYASHFLLVTVRHPGFSLFDSLKQRRLKWSNIGGKKQSKRLLNNSVGCFFVCLLWEGFYSWAGNTSNVSSDLVLAVQRIHCKKSGKT